MRPALRYSEPRDAYVLRGVGSTRGPVLRVERRRVRRERSFDGADRRGSASLA